MWIMDQLGYAGPMNEYLGVFWWNERVLSGGSVSTAQVTFSGIFSAGDSVFLNLNGSTLGKSVFTADTPQSIAKHFAMYVNGAFVGAWAQANGAVLTLTSRSPASSYALTVSPSTTSVTGQAVVTSGPTAAAYGTWLIDDTANPPMNRATRDWHADFYAQCARRSREVVTACSMELVFPPDRLRRAVQRFRRYACCYRHRLWLSRLEPLCGGRFQIAGVSEVCLQGHRGAAVGRWPHAFRSIWRIPLVVFRRSSRRHGLLRR